MENNDSVVSFDSFSRESNFACRSGKHYWFKQADAEKCCDGKHKRVLIFDGGDNQIQCGNRRIGRAWTLIDPPISAP